MEKKVLIAVDDEIICNRFAENLTQHISSLQAISVKNGIEACKSALSIRPDIIILDWDLSKMSGLIVLERLKKNDLTKDVPIIMLSKDPDSDKLTHALKAGATNFLSLSIAAIELLARVKSALSLSLTLQELQNEHHKLQLANHRNETILHAILPNPILSQLKKYGAIPPRLYKNTVVLFVDMVDFTPKTSKMAPRRLLRELNDLFTGFDRIIEAHRCTRIKTIGDAYMAVCGMFDAPQNIALQAASAALKIRQYLNTRNQTSSIQWELKIGLYCGDVMGSSVSPTNLSFDIFGETVNMASRFQELCEPMQINVSETIKLHLEHHFKFIGRTARTVKGKGVMPMYYLHQPIKGMKA
ncbi:MAG: response regulator [Marinilabiliaceae bacterium]|nr:response regulator [Marinilabiliaceae bacterium]